MSLDYTVNMSDLPVDHPLLIAAREARDARLRFNDLAARYGRAPWRALPERIGVLYDEEHIDGVGGYHATDEKGTFWLPTISEGPGNIPGKVPQGREGKTLLPASYLRAAGYEVPPFTGTPCPRCFGGV
jgi:hypothetical protein